MCKRCHLLLDEAICKLNAAENRFNYLTDKNQIDKAILDLEVAKMAVDIIIQRARDGNCEEVYANVQELD
jgi:hypothetical protein